MTKTFRTRALLLAFFPIAGLLILALWVGQGDDDSMSADAPVARAATPGERGPLALPGGSSSTATPGALPVPDDGDATADADEGAGDTRHYGRVSGRLVDGLGRPVGGEPVYLLLASDPWEHGVPRAEDPTPQERLRARTLADADGRFALPAEAGVQHDLYAGGASWARVRLDDVVSGDDVDVVLADGFVLEGVVRDETSGMPASDAWVLALADGTQLLARTGADGRYRIGPVPELVALVGAYARGTGIALQGEVLPAQGELVLDLPAGTPVVGRLVDAETEEPVAGAELRLVIDVVAQLAGTRDELPVHQAVEEQLAKGGKDGSFELPGGPERGFVLDVTAPGYVPLRYDRFKDRNRDPGEPLLIKLARVQPLLGTALVAEDGAPAAGALLELHAAQGVVSRAEAGADGAFSLDVADWDGRGALYVHARDAEGRTARKRAGKLEDPVELQLVPPLALTVEVVLDDAPVAGAMVAVRSDDALTTSARTDAEGRVALVHELAGPEGEAAHVEARWGTLQSVPADVEVAEPPEEPLRIVLDAGDWLEGYVSDTFGTPVSSAELSLRADPRSGSPMRLVGHADVRGGFKLGPLTPDVSWRLTVQAEGHRDKSLGNVVPGPDPLYVRLDRVVSWSGRVVDASTGKPASSFSGQLLRLAADVEGNKMLINTRERLKHVPGAPGEFSVPIPEPGRYLLRILAKDCMPAESLPVDTNGVTPPPFVELMIWPAALLDVVVQDGRGRPVQGFEVSAVPWELAGGGAGPSPKARKAGERARTDQDGVAHFNLGKGGDYRLAGGPGAWLDEVRVSALPGVTARRVFRLPATGDLELTVVDENGQPLGGVMVELRSSREETAHSIFRRTGMRDGAGTVSFETLPPGQYSLRLRRRNYQSANHDLYVRGNATERVRLPLQPRTESSPGQQGWQAGQALDQRRN